MNFELLALKEFPNLKDRITIQQINHIRNKYGLKSPPLHIVNNRNKIERAVYKFSVDIESNIDEPEKEYPIAVKYSIDKRFDFIRYTVLMVANGVQNSCIIAGSGGLGKSFTVLKTLKEDDYVDFSADLEIDLAEFQDEKCFRVVKGYSTARGLYNTLYHNRNNLIIFDDTDAVLKDVVGLNLLKSCLDSNESRIVSWNKAMSVNDSIPTAFEFNGQVIFITNLSIDGLDQALKSRSMIIDVTMTLEEKIERMEFLILQSDFMPNANIEHKRDALDLITNIKNQIKELNLRSLIQTVTIRKSNEDNWRELAIYILTNN